ncbi:Hydrogenase-4 component E [Pasteurella multocida]|uniref:NADH-ubiquinone/plastoquinone oxidoreductase chain 4L n=1 Tax=Pasteurella dagmatis ATCC 43325 TaxID=667128 RepID=C9PPU9_9PAST|nr:hydrogenase 4 membrane subunit [Pasteurella dagmatis]EEX50400.1 NADH-ubiquinone/plastoquinone oxidoreductase chain 4L [Pasteurella dagmatis ATCC 43325]SNV56372.1 Hydrogenase-4 component E [Pasteurella dagmatis]VEI58076.1 Hydrogenase-4 component E [Pasteurella multocida]
MMNLALINSLAGLLIFTSVIVIYTKTVKSAAISYAVQSLVLVALFYFLAKAMNAHELYMWSISAFFTKVVLVPALIFYMARKLPENDFADGVNKAWLIPIFPVIMIVSYLIVEPINLAIIENVKPAFAVSFSHFFLGLLCIVSQRHLLKQVFGYCLMENGAHLSLALLGHKAPELVEIGISTDAIFAIVIMVVLVNKIYKKINSLDANDLSELKG